MWLQLESENWSLDRTCICAKSFFFLDTNEHWSDLCYGNTSGWFEVLILIFSFLVHVVIVHANIHYSFPIWLDAPSTFLQCVCVCVSLVLMCFLVKLRIYILNPGFLIFCRNYYILLIRRSFEIRKMWEILVILFPYLVLSTAVREANSLVLSMVNRQNFILNFMSVPLWYQRKDFVDPCKIVVCPLCLRFHHNVKNLVKKLPKNSWKAR